MTQAQQSPGWKECPQTFTVYQNCSHTIEAIFTANCADYHFTVEFNKKEYNENDNSEVYDNSINDTRCLVSFYIVNVMNETHNVVFRASIQQPNSDVPTLPCTDVLEVYTCKLLL